MGSHSNGLDLPHALRLSLVLSPLNIAGKLSCPFAGCYWALGRHLSLDAVGWFPSWLACVSGFFTIVCCIVFSDVDLVGWGVLASCFSFPPDSDLLWDFAPYRICCDSLLSSCLARLKVFRQGCTSCPDSWQWSGSAGNGRQDSAASGDAV